MTTRGCFNYKLLIIRTLGKISVFNKCKKDFFCEVIILLLSIKGRINFLQLGRFGDFSEQRYRQQFEKPFPWLDFNKELTLSHAGKRFVIAFDPSCINNSGNKILEVGWYWSGYVGQAKWRFEILDCYQRKFQIEFLYRNAKQSTGLKDSQVHSKNKLDFYFNTAHTAINIVKVKHLLSQLIKVRKHFSMTNIKTINTTDCYCNKFLTCSVFIHTLLKTETMSMHLIMALMPLNLLTMYLLKFKII